ncbi:MAG TPA: hypothetical protein VF928_06310 [Usitatibacteraceae bacterium]
MQITIYRAFQGIFALESAINGVLYFSPRLGLQNYPSVTDIVTHHGPATLKSGKMHQGNQANRPDFSHYGTQ